jgi:hypothetical protein
MDRGLQIVSERGDCFGIGLQGGWGGFRFFGCEPLIRMGPRRSDRHCFLVRVLENLSERGPDVLCAFLTLRGHFQSIGYPLACLRSLRRVDLSINRPSLSRKNACQNFEAGLLWTLAIMQRIFSSATRRETLGKHLKGGRRGGELKIDWTKPPPRA